jgi:hypothetical protein
MLNCARGKQLGKLVFDLKEVNRIGYMASSAASSTPASVYNPLGLVC